MMSDSDSLDISDRNLWAVPLLNTLRTSLTPELVSIDISNNHISADCSQLLSDFIRESGALRLLNVSSTLLTKSGATMLFSAIKGSNVEELYADDNIFMKESCAALGNSLAGNAKLRILSVCGCDISDESCIEIAKGIDESSALQQLRIESNSIFDTGAVEVANAIKRSKLELVSVADNQIWNNGTKSIIEAAGVSRYLNALDLSYNIVDLELLLNLLKDNKNIEAIGISGCKVNENKFCDFLKKLYETNLKMLIINGLNFNELPVSWPEVEDKIWAKYFDTLIFTLANFSSLKDLRIGFLNLEQLYKLCSSLEKIKKDDLTISFQDFGHTGDCWVYYCSKDHHFEAATEVFTWNDEIPENYAFMIGNILKSTKFNNDGIQGLDLHYINLSDNSFINIINSIINLEIPLKTIDISGNKNITKQESMEALLKYLSISNLNSLNLYNTGLSDSSYIKFFSSESLNNLKKLTFSFQTSDKNELSEHPFFKELGNFMRNNPALHELKIHGYITAKDSYNIISNLIFNTNLQKLELISLHSEKYRDPDPYVSDEVQRDYDELFDKFHSVLMDSKCMLHTLIYPLMTEVFVYSEKSIEKFSFIEDKLNANRKCVSK